MLCFGMRDMAAANTLAEFLYVFQLSANASTASLQCCAPVIKPQYHQALASSKCAGPGLRRVLRQESWLLSAPTGTGQSWAACCSGGDRVGLENREAGCEAPWPAEAGGGLCAALGRPSMSRADGTLGTNYSACNCYKMLWWCKLLQCTPALVRFGYMSRCPWAMRHRTSIKMAAHAALTAHAAQARS